MPRRCDSETLRKLILERVTVQTTGRQCWRWNLFIDQHGYAKCAPRFGSTFAHRATYELWRGEIPPGLQIDHLCRVRDCVNPWHLEIVTCRENHERGKGNMTKTHCPAGHEYSDDNTHRDENGHRHCRICDRNRKQSRRDGGRESYNAYMREYRQRNLEKMRAYDRKRRPPGTQANAAKEARAKQLRCAGP